MTSIVTDVDIRWQIEV